MRVFRLAYFQPRKPRNRESATVESRQSDRHRYGNLMRCLQRYPARNVNQLECSKLSTTHRPQRNSSRHHPYYSYAKYSSCVQPPTLRIASSVYTTITNLWIRATLYVSVAMLVDKTCQRKKKLYLLYSLFPKYVMPQKLHDSPALLVTQLRIKNPLPKLHVII
jgi:hypothetical protein